MERAIASSLSSSRAITTVRPSSSTSTTSARIEKEPVAPPVDLTPLEAAEWKDQEADELLAQGDVDGTLMALQKAIYFHPEHAPFHAKLAKVYAGACDIKSAMACYRKLFSIDKNPSQTTKDQFASLLDLHGYSLLMLGETPSVAIAYLNEAIQLNSLEETFWLHRALAHIHANALEKALKDVDHCVNLNGRDAEYFVLRAKLHWKLHMHEKATHDIHKAARLVPDHPEVVAHEQRLLNESQTIYEQACQHVMVQKYTDAIKCLTKAAEISPEETKIYLLRASAYREAGDLQSAMKDIDQAMTCHTHKLDRALHKKKAPHFLHHHSHHQAPPQQQQQSLKTTEHQQEDRTKEYREIVTQRNLIVTDLALRFLKDKSYQVALNAMNQVIQGEMEISKRFNEVFATPQYYVNRGDAYRGLRNFHAALADYHHAQELVPESQEIRSRVALVHYQFGIDLFNQTQFDRAEVEFAKAIAADDAVATYHIRKGDAARYQEKDHVACQDYISAMKLNPHDADTSNKLLQYAVDPATIGKKTVESPKKAPREKESGWTTSNQNQRSSTTEVAGTTMATTPPPQQRARGGNGSLNDALKSCQKKNKVVKDLFLNRPSLPPPAAKTTTTTDRSSSKR